MNYWKKRATQQLLKTEKKSEKVIDELVNLYDRSFSDIEQRIRHIFETYTNDGQMTKLEALKYLNEMETAKYYDGIRKKIPKAESEEEKQQLLNIYNSRAYGYRISRLMALENEMYMTIIRCKGIEEKLTRRHYEEIIIDRYQELIKDNVFTATTKYELEQMLDEKWLGSNFSDRIWKDQKKLTEELNKVLKVGLFTGKSNVSIAEEIKKRMNVSLFNATRLVRTESNYYHNQIDLRAYKDMGIEKYRYLAVLDNRTSDICQELDGEVFEVSKAEVGVNFPPMHSFCRSTTIRADVKIKERIAKNPITGERETIDNVEYKDWLKGINTLKNTPKSSKINIHIDEMTPCLYKKETKEYVDTYFTKMTDKKELERLTKDWKFNWTEENNVYGLYSKDNKDRLQGLISYEIQKENKAVYIKLLENNPNNVKYKTYTGVGGHLIAQACKISFNHKYDGFVYLDAKTDLIKHYKKYGAKQFSLSQRMIFDETSAKKLVEEYYGKGQKK